MFLDWLATLLAKTIVQLVEPTKAKDLVVSQAVAKRMKELAKEEASRRRSE